MYEKNSIRSEDNKDFCLRFPASKVTVFIFQSIHTAQMKFHLEQCLLLL